MPDTRVTVSDHMVVSAVRYALGRSTYVVGWTIGELIRIWDDLPVSTRSVVLRDVNDALNTTWPPMMDMDRAEWVRLIQFTEHQLQRDCVPSGCQCSCHQPGMQVSHLVACCNAGVSDA